MTTHFDPQPLPKGFDEKQARAWLEEFRSYHEDIERERTNLLEDHEGQWVMSYKGQFVFGDTIKDVIEAATQATWPVNLAAIMHLTRVRAKVLL